MLFLPAIFARSTDHQSAGSNTSILFGCPLSKRREQKLVIISLYVTCMYVSRHTSCVSSQESRIVCYLQEPLTSHFQLLVSLKPLGWFLSNSHILCPPYTRPYIPNLKEIGPAVHEICIPENCPIFFTFFFTFFFFAPFYKSNFEPTKDTLSIDLFLSYLAHL